MGALSGLDPGDVLQYFEAISRIPRGSGNMQTISDYVKAECEKAGAVTVQDGSLNVIARKKATPGRENAPVVMMQGHLDMVAEKEADSTHDFKKDPISLRVDGDWIKADGTTLGADDGIGVAFMLALLHDDTFSHPALECVFTTDEETGMFGAVALDLSGSKAEYLLNLDNEAEGVFTVSCAGGARFRGTLPIRRAEKSGRLWKIIVKSGKGGHSGTEIKFDRPNTNVVAEELIAALSERDPDFALVSVSGGLMDNAIPTRTEIEAMVNDLSCLPELENQFRLEFASTDDNVTFEAVLENERADAAVFSKESLDDALFIFMACPNGATAYHHKIEGLVDTSLNQGILRTEEDVLEIHFSVRSSLSSRKQKLLKKLSAILTRAGGSYEISGDYPGWAYREDSPLREQVISVWNALYPERPAVVEAIHAGLECGLLIEKKPELDVVSFGPTALDIHTPKERVSVSSIGRFHAFLKKLLESIQ